MRGQKKPETQLKLDRDRVLPFYITPEQAARYAEDEYKYIIHLYRLFPTDEFHVLQFLLLKFHPLILKICHKFHEKKIELDWMDLVSFARYSFVELVMRFDLNSTLYFKTYIPMALDRAVNDFHIYDIRRKNLIGAIRLDALTPPAREALLQEYADITNQNTESTDQPANLLADYKVECIHFVEIHPEITPQDKEIFLGYYLRGQEIEEVARKANLSPEVTKRRLATVMLEVKEHIRENFL